MAIFINVDNWKTEKLCEYVNAYECKDCHKIFLEGKHCPKCGSQNIHEGFVSWDKIKLELED